MFKKLISMVLVLTMVLSVCSTSFAGTSNSNSGINEILKKQDEMYLKKGFTLVKRDIEVITPSQRVKRSAVIGSGDLQSYNGYKLRYTKVNSQYNEAPTTIGQGEATRSLLSKAFNVTIGLATKAWIWVPATVLGIDPTIFKGTSSDLLSSQVQYIDTTIIVEIEDKKGRHPGSSYYPYSTTHSVEAINNVLFSGMDKYGKSVTKTGQDRTTVKSAHYNDFNWMRRMAYENYMYGNSEAFDKILY